VWSTPGLLEDFTDLVGRYKHKEVCRRLNEKYAGITLTKNASIAKANRLGLTCAAAQPKRDKKLVRWGVSGAIDALKTLWIAGLNRDVIARRLEENFGLVVTAKAVSAKAHKLGLPPRQNHTDGARTRKAKGTGWHFPSVHERAAPLTQAERMEYRRALNNGAAPVRKTQSPIPPEDTHTPPEMRKPLIDLTDDEGRDLGLCHWPYGDRDFKFCARPIGGNHERYCEFHGLLHAYGRRGVTALYCEAAE
jgi:hypothetical protein